MNDVRCPLCREKALASTTVRYRGPSLPSATTVIYSCDHAYTRFSGFSKAEGLSSNNNLLAIQSFLTAGNTHVLDLVRSALPGVMSGGRLRRWLLLWGVPAEKKRELIVLMEGERDA